MTCSYCWGKSGGGHVDGCAQLEIDRLCAEGKLLNNKIDACVEEIDELEAENARLRDMLAGILSATREYLKHQYGVDFDTYLAAKEAQAKGEGRILMEDAIKMLRGSNDKQNA